MIVGQLEHLLTGNRWALGWPPILMALVVPVILVALADRLMRRR